MLVWIIIIVIAIIVLLLWWYSEYTYYPSTPSDPSNQSDSSNPSNYDNTYPTMHARCHSNSTCGGDLTCDLGCHRCKKKLGGDCAIDIDCESGLQCHNWKCVPNTTLSSHINSSFHHINGSPYSKNNKRDQSKSVRWNDDLNDIFYI